jgi:hypothetical protein
MPVEYGNAGGILFAEAETLLRGVFVLGVIGGFGAIDGTISGDLEETR